MDLEQEQRVWQRVRGELPILEAAECAGILRALYKYGKARELTARLLQTQMEHLDTLRGMCRSLGRPEPGWVIADPRNTSCPELAQKAIELTRRLRLSYGAFARDETFGPVFALLEAETVNMEKELLRLYSRV